jgi:hypothetical protein
MLPSEILMSYENLVNAFEDISSEANCGFVFVTQNPAACFRSTRTRVIFDLTIHCKEWKWKSSTDPLHKTKVVNIVVSAHEEIRRHKLALMSSVVEVCYLDVVDGCAQLLQSVHFDYDPCQRDHALFHAQVSNQMVIIPNEQRGPLEIDFTLPEAAQPRHRSARIPTSDMTLSSVLVSLTADHIGGQLFRKFQRTAAGYQEKMPLPVIGRLCKSLNAETRDLRSSHWYCHTKPA